MAGLPWSKFFWADWESDEGLRQCSLAAQGLWMRMLCVCAKGDPPGYLAIAGKPLDVDGVARMAGVSSTEAATLMEELEHWGVFSRDRANRIYSRRLIRDAKRSKEGKKNANKRWGKNTESKEENHEPNRAANGVGTTQKPEARSQKPDSSVSNETGPRPPGDLASKVFGDCREWLVEKGGMTEDRARSFLGKMRKDFSDGDIINAVTAAQRIGAQKPEAYIRKALGGMKARSGRERTAGDGISLDQLRKENLL